MEHAVALDSCVIHQNIHRSILFNDKINQSLNLLLIAYIHHIVVSLNADFACKLYGLLRRDYIGSYNIAAVFRQAQCNSPAKSATGAGNNCHLTFQTVHDNLLLIV